MIEVARYDGERAERFATEKERLAAFRDALRRDPGLAATYAVLKSGLAGSGVDLVAYTEGKRESVASVLADAGIELRPR